MAHEQQKPVAEVAASGKAYQHSYYFIKIYSCCFGKLTEKHELDLTDFKLSQQFIIYVEPGFGCSYHVKDGLLLLFQRTILPL
jgi:hypothetical protein